MALTHLPVGEVHLWRWRLDVTVPDDEVERWLTRDECVRAARYRFEAPRRRFVAARMGLRRVLSRYLGGATLADLAFALGPHGKPSLALPAHGWLRFNLAHTGDLALCAVSREREVGVDLEHVAGSRTTASTLRYAAQHLCSSVEQRRLAGLTPEAWGAMFLTLWTCKEAIGKARGTGLKPPVPSFDALLASESLFPSAWRHREVRLLPGLQPHTWSVVRLEPFARTVGALAAEVLGGDGGHEIELVWFDTEAHAPYQATGTC